MGTARCAGLAVAERGKAFNTPKLLGRDGHRRRLREGFTDGKGRQLAGGQAHVKARPVAVAQDDHRGPALRQVVERGHEAMDAAAVRQHGLVAQPAGLQPEAVMEGTRRAFRGRHALVARSTDQLAAMQGLVPPPQAFRVGDQRARGVRLGHAEQARGRHLTLGVQGVALGHALEQLVARLVVHGGDVGRLQQQLVDGLVPGLAGDGLDDRAQQHVARIVVGPLLAGREIGGLALELLDQFRGAQVAAHRVAHIARDAGVALDARGVVEQLQQRDLAAVGIVGQEPGQRVIEARLAVVDLLQQRGSRELFGDRADAHELVGLHGHAQLDAGQTAGPLVEQLVAAGHQHGHTRAVRLDLALVEQPVGIGLHGRGRGRLTGMRRSPAQGQEDGNRN
mmetsp:Transcript_7031/g.29877  ORF Transcript_7031/g.29877 Transcript_7031/m.29877 type:complete len:394 (+) Transcript_7031:3100-4281(+)